MTDIEELKVQLEEAKAEYANTIYFLQDTQKSLQMNIEQVEKLKAKMQASKNNIEGMEINIRLREQANDGPDPRLGLCAEN